MGTPSLRTMARLAPDAPTPRKLTPCEVGFAVRLPERRKSVKPGTCLSTSSKVSAAVVLRSSGDSMMTLAAVSLTRVAARSAVTVICSATVAGDSVRWRFVASACFALQVR